jgi:hypothetical protein
LYLNFIFIYKKKIKAFNGILAKYRMSGNKEVPKKASNFINNIYDPLNKFI